MILFSNKRLVKRFYPEPLPNDVSLWAAISSWILLRIICQKRNILNTPLWKRTHALYITYLAFFLGLDRE